MSNEVLDYDKEEQRWLDEVYQGDKQPEWTWKVFVMGVILAAVMVTFNVYMGLKTGWGEGGSLIAVILGFAIMKMFRQDYSELENNMTQTMASAGGSIGNIVNVIPALFLMASSGLILSAPTWVDIFLWVFFTSFLGIFYAIPLRKQIIVVEQLKFPTGTACAATIKAMHSTGAAALKKAKMLGGFGLVSGIFTWFRDGVPTWIPNATYIPGTIKGIKLSSLTMGFSWSPMMFGAGFLVGHRVGLSMLLGSVVTFAILAPWLFETGILQEVATMMGKGALTEPSYPMIVKWTMWPALGIMITYGITATAMKWKVVVRAFKSMLGGSKQAGPASHLDIPFKVWLGGLLFSATGVILMLNLRFDVPIWVGILVIPLSFVFSAIAVRATGETDINPVGSMGSVTQIIFGALNPAAMSTLLTGGVAASGASESADMMQDLKTGYLLGATPKKQTYIQILGVLVGALVAVPIFLVLIKAYGIGSEKLPAPAAITWSGLAQMMSKGVSSLPSYATLALLIGSIIGLVLGVIESTKFKFKGWLPSATGLGIAMVVPAIYSWSMCFGSVVCWIIYKKKPQWIEDYAASIGAGGIAGEGLVGVLAAVLVVLGIL